MLRVLLLGVGGDDGKSHNNIDATGTGVGTGW